jgi:hypothetical protein
LCLRQAFFFFSAMPGLREYWASGFRALHIEESIGNAFADFAPYAGADEQRVVVTRQSSSLAAGRAPANVASTAAVGTPLGPASYVSSSSAVIMEDSGDFTVQARDANAGSITFSTTGHLQLDAALRVPLPPPSMHNNADVAEATTRAQPTDSPKQPPQRQTPAQQFEEGANVLVHPVVKPMPSQLRFSDFTRPVSEPTPRPACDTTAGGAAHRSATSTTPLGQLELDASLPDWDSNRQSLGVRFGPAAVRLTRVFSAAATATAKEAAMLQLQNSGSLIDEDEMAPTLRIERSRKYQHTLDAALCIPFGGRVLLPSKPTAATKPEGAGVKGQCVVRTLQGDRVELRAAPWALTCGLQFPLDLGDTLVGISLQNDRTTSIALPHPGVEWAVPVVSPSPSSSPDTSVREAASVACVPSPFFSQTAAASSARSDDNPSRETPAAGTAATTAPLPSYVVLPFFTMRFLLVQTLASHTLVRDTSPLPSPHRDDSGQTSSLNTSGLTRLASSYDWRRLPTLIGVNVGLDRERLRLSAASIVHDGNMDLELAGVLDMTPWTPRIPTLVKVGYNNVGRFAAGITSLFYETVSATLGVHVARGEQPKFGIEVQF